MLVQKVAWQENQPLPCKLGKNSLEFDSRMTLSLVSKVGEGSYAPSSATHESWMPAKKIRTVDTKLDREDNSENQIYWVQVFPHLIEGTIGIVEFTS